MKVAFVTPESFLDVDMPIVRELNKHIDLLWIVTFSISNKNTEHVFSPEQITEYAALNKILALNILCNHRVRDPRRIKTSVTIINKIREYSPEVIYFNSFFDPYLAVISKFLLGKKRLIIGLHDIELHPGADSGFHKLSHWIIMNSFRNYHIYSKSQLGLFKKLHPDKSPFLIGLFLKDFGEPQKNESKGKDHKVHFLFFGRDYPYKGLEILFEAARLLSTKTSKFVVSIVGKSESFEKYKLMTDNESIYNLRPEFIESNEISNVFCEADFLILPYNQVTQCGPLLIALRYNLPVIATDLPYFREHIIDGSTGYLFEGGNHPQLAELMNKIVLKNESELQNMRKQLSEYISENFRIEEYIKKYLEMFSSVLQ